MIALASLPLIACGGGDDDGATTPDGGNAPMGTYNHFVNDTITVPASAPQTASLGLNIDGDDHNRPDNALGGILSALKAQGVDIQKAVTDSVTGGKLILLHSIQATALDNATNVGWKVLLGDAKDPAPLFDGTDMFNVSATSPQDGLLMGQIAGGSFQGGPGNVTIALSLTTGDPIRVKLVGTRIKANLTADGCTDGVLGGAITEQELNDAVMPGIQTLMVNSINDDGPTGGAPVACPTDGSACPNAMSGDTTSCVAIYGNKCLTKTSKTILDLFDINHDLNITLDELKNATIIKALLAPDVDLFDASGAFNPRVDKKADSLSVGIGFTCKKGTFTVTGE